MVTLNNIEAAENIVNGLSALIKTALEQCEMERTNPGFNPDLMDAKIKHYRERSVTLRRLRDEFENEMATTYSQGN